VQNKFRRNGERNLVIYDFIVETADQLVNLGFL